MSTDDKVIERKLILKRAFPRHQLFEIGRRLSIPYFARLEDAWSMDEEQAALEIASAISDSQLKEVFQLYKPRKWASFRGKYYTFEDGVFTLKGSWDNIRTGIREIKDKYGRSGAEVLKVLLQSGEGCGLRDIASQLKKPVNLTPIIADLEKLKIVEVSYRGENYAEWRIPDEVFPLVQHELGTPLKTRAPSTTAEAAQAVSAAGEGEVDYVELERQEIAKMDNMLNEYLADLLKHRLDATIKFGKTFSVKALADYLINLFGPVLYFDSFLSIIQQYGLAEVEIVHEKGKTGMRTGYNLALFGEPGTGKSFSTRDMILGKIDAKIYPHGIPGRNRYAAGMSPARFIRIGQAYAGRTFNFIVPEFNDWFKYKGMVEPLKLAMERGIIKYELHREVIGPYRFNSFFSVNYNVATFGRGYEVTISDPNFSLPYDEIILIYGPDGYGFVKIGELVESEPKDVKVVSFNPETFQVELCKVTGYFKHPPSRIYEVRLRSGRRVKVTAGHSLFTISESGEIHATSAINLKPGDYVVIPRRIPHAPEPLTKLNVARLLLKAGLSAKIFIRFTGVQKHLTEASSLRAFSKRINKPYTTVCYWKKNSKMPLEVYAKIDPNLSSLPPDAVLILPNGKVFPATIDLDEDFAWFLGFYLAEGDVHAGRYVRLGTKNEAYAARIKAVAEKLRIKATYNGKVVVLNSAMLVRLLAGLKIGRNSHEKRIPSIIFNLPPNCVKAFMDGYFAGDGYLNAKQGEIVAGAVSEYLPSDEMYLMLILNKVVRTTRTERANFITVPKRGGFSINVPCAVIKQFVKKIREKTQLSQRAFSTLLKGSISRFCLAEIETGYHDRVKRQASVRLLEALPGDLKEIQETEIIRRLVMGDLAWDEVLEVVDTGFEEPTYDLEVRPDGRKIENFLGGYGGIFLHNSAVEDRMLCRLHRLTKERFVEIAQSQRRLAFGEIDTEKGAGRIRDHVTLVYAIETGHPLVRDRFPKKPVMITPKVYEAIEKARSAILECIPRENVTFSARLEDRAIRFACTASMLNYFSSSLDYVPVSDDALKYAVQLYVEEASVRSRQEFMPEEVLSKIKV